jgi:hypothetical protein
MLRAEVISVLANVIAAVIGAILQLGKAALLGIEGSFDYS